MHAQIEVWVSPTAAEQAEQGALSRAAAPVLLAPGFWSLAELARALMPALLPGMRLPTVVQERVLVLQAVLQVWPEAVAGSERQARLGAALQRSLCQLGAADVDAACLRAWTAALPSAARRAAAPLLAALQWLEVQSQARAWLLRHSLWTALRQALASGAPPPEVLQQVPLLRLHADAQVSPALWQLWMVLAQQRRSWGGRRTEVWLPWADIPWDAATGAPGLMQHSVHWLRTFEARGAELALEVVPDMQAAGPLFGAPLASGSRGASPAASRSTAADAVAAASAAGGALELSPAALHTAASLVAPGPSLSQVACDGLGAQVQAAAWLVDAHLRAGFAPEQIAVAARRPASVLPALAAALQAADIPVQGEVATALSQTPWVQWVRRLLQVALEGGDGTALCELWQSDWLAGALPTDIDIESAALVQALQQFAAVAMPDPSLDSVAVRCRAAAAAGLDARLEPAAQALVWLGQQLAPLAQCIDGASAVAALRRLVGTLAARVLARTQPAVADLGVAACWRDRARLRQHIDALHDALDALAEAVSSAASLTPWQPAMLLSLFDAAVASALWRDREPKADGVQLGSFARLAHARFAVVILVDMHGAACPAEAPVDPWLPAPHWTVLSERAAAGALPELRPGPLGDGRAYLPALDSAEGLLLWQAATAATQHLALLWPTRDAQAAALAPSPYLGVLQRLAQAAGTCTRFFEHHHQPFAMREAALAPAAARRVTVRACFASQAEVPAALGDIAARAAVEQGRQAWFLGGRAGLQRALSALPRGLAAASPAALQPHLGWLPAPLWRHGALARLGSEAEPLSASALERYAACPFRFFAADVLRVRTTPLRQEESEAGEAGAIAHRAFEVVIRALLAAGHSALGPGSREACRTVATAALAAWWPQEGRLERLHPVLREQTEAQVQAQVLALLADLCAEASDFRLHGVELGFGQPGDAWPALRVDLPASPPPPAAASGALPTAVAAAPDASLWLRGRIDLLERAGTWARVSDLKSARLSSLQPRLRPSSFAVEALQLPIYAAAVQAAEPGLSGCDVRYLSLRDGRAGAGVWSLTEGRGAFRGQAAALAERLRVQPTASPPTALGARLASLTTQLRQGQFPAKPRAGACRLCDMQAICRISAQAQAMAGGDEGEAHGAP